MKKFLTGDSLGPIQITGLFAQRRKKKQKISLHFIFPFMINQKINSLKAPLYIFIAIHAHCQTLYFCLIHAALISATVKRVIMKFNQTELTLTRHDDSRCVQRAF